MIKLTRAQVVRRAAISLCLVATLACSAYHGVQHAREQLWLAATSQRVVAEAGARTPREKVIALRDYLRHTVKHRDAEHDDRPFLRATGQETIESGRGYCGESARAFILLAHGLGLRAQRVNLEGRLRHVVAEVDLGERPPVLFDPQDNADLNAYFDGRDVTADELILQPGSPFSNYSNLNLRRVPLLGSLVRRVKVEECRLTRILESPWLIKCYLELALSGSIIAAFVADRVLVRVYARRLGVAGRTCRRPPARVVIPEGPAAPLVVRARQASRSGYRKIV